MEAPEKTGQDDGGVIASPAALPRKTQVKKKPSAYDQRAAVEHSLGMNGHTGRRVVVEHWNQGVMEKYSSYTKEDNTTQKERT